MSRYNLRSNKKVNVIEDKPTRPTRFAVVYFDRFPMPGMDYKNQEEFEDYEDYGPPKDTLIGVFDSEIDACYGIIDALIYGNIAFDLQDEFWKKIPSDQDKIKFLRKQVKNYDDLIKIIYKYRASEWRYGEYYYFELFKN